jgi:TolA-binding protein
MKLRTITILIAFYAFSGCVYFNTYYNTKKLYKEASKERENRQGEEPSRTEITKYDQTIEKASKILELHPNSKYVDDAVMILGECFYHKRDYVKAARKFEELITYFPESKHTQEAKLWLAKTNIQVEDYLTAKFQIDELLNSDDVKRDVEDESRFLLGEIQYEQDYIIEAEQTYNQVSADAKNQAVRANAFFKLGLCQLRLDYYEEAVASFKGAADNSPNKKFKFEAELNYARALKRSGEFGRAKNVCRRLLDDASLKEHHGAVKLELADCIYAEGKALNEKLRGADLNYLGKVEQALDEYKKITLEFKKTEVAAQAYFEIARIYEEDYGDFAQAKEYYEKVKQEYPKSELVTVSNKKNKDLSDLARLASMVNKSQGIQTGENGSSSYQLSELELVLLEHRVDPELRFLKKKKKEATNDGTESADLQNGATNGKAEEDIDALITNKLQLAEIYMFQFGQMDSAMAQYDEIIELFPNHPSTAKAIYSKAFIFENEYQDKDKTDSLLYFLVHGFPDSYQADEARRILNLPMKNKQKDPVYELYKKAEGSLLSGRNLDNTISEFQLLAQDYPDSEYAPKALYATGWIYESMKFENEKALEIYQTIVETYPDSEYAKKVEKKITATTQPPPDEGEKKPEKAADVSKRPAVEEELIKATAASKKKPDSGKKSQKIKR